MPQKGKLDIRGQRKRSAALVEMAAIGLIEEMVTAVENLMENGLDGEMVFALKYLQQRCKLFLKGTAK